jgi:NADH-quinone oxidoreductase subunit E
MPFSPDVRERLAADARQIMGRYPVARSALLPMLHLVQSEEGYISPDGVAFCSDMLELTTAEVSAVATFYSQFKRHPNGTYTLGVCTNTLCAVMGGDAIYESLAAYLGIGHDETTEDGAITLERVECNAACDYAPVVMVNWEFFDNQTPASARVLADKLRSGQPVAPSRGPDRVATFKEVSRVLAGFLDEHANEGVGGGTATLQGTLLAKREGWTAPPVPPAPSAPGDTEKREG